MFTSQPRFTRRLWSQAPVFQEPPARKGRMDRSETTSESSRACGGGSQVWHWCGRTQRDYLARELKAELTLIDDLRARRLAQREGFEIRGTVGLSRTPSPPRRTFGSSFRVPTAFEPRGLHRSHPAESTTFVVRPAAPLKLPGLVAWLGSRRPVASPKKRDLKEDVVLSVGRTLGLSRKEIEARLDPKKTKGTPKKP